MPSLETSARTTALAALGAILLCGLVVAGASAGAQPDNGNATSVSSSEVDVTVKSQSWAYTRSKYGITQEVGVVFGDNISFDDVDYRLVVHDVDAGGSVTITPPSNLSVGPATEPDMSVYIRNSKGQLLDSPAIWVQSHVHDLEATTTGSFATGGITNMRFELVDGNGETVAETGQQPYLIAYNESVTPTVTDSEIQFTLPRGPLPESSSVTVEVFNASESQWDAEKTPVTLSYDEGSDAFVGAIGDNQFAAGNYTYRLTVSDESGLYLREVAENLDYAYQSVTPIVIEERQPGERPTLPNAAGPAGNLDDDPLLEDVNGDGDGNIFDALSYYNNRNTDAIQNNPTRFNFDGNEPTGTIFDALELYNKLTR